jgi:hypothetical protein
MNRPAPALRAFGLVVVLVVGASLLLAGCGSIFIGGCINSTPVPKLIAVSPSKIDTASLPVTMTVTGSDFQAWSTIHWNSASLPTTFVDSQHLSVVVTPQILTLVTIDNGTGTISVFTAGQSAGDNFVCANGGSSSTFVIIIN